MTFSESIRACLSKYADFSGRASRSEFWWFGLFQALVFAALSVVDPSMMLYNLGLILLFLPSLTAAVRRFHDVGKSGWWFLILFLPLIGIFIYLYFMISKSEAGPNRFGPQPGTRDMTPKRAF